MNQCNAGTASANAAYILKYSNRQDGYDTSTALAASPCGMLKILLMQLYFHIDILPSAINTVVKNTTIVNQEMLI